MILDVPEPDDVAPRAFRDAFRRHIDLPTVAADDKTLGQRPAVGSCGGPSAPAPLAAAPASLPRTPSSGARDGAGDLSQGGVFDRPACVSRLLRRDRIRHALIVCAVALVLAGAAFTLVMALVHAPSNVGR